MQPNLFIALHRSLYSTPRERRLHSLDCYEDGQAACAAERIAAAALAGTKFLFWIDAFALLLKASITLDQPMIAGGLTVKGSFATLALTSYPKGVGTSEREGIATPCEVQIVIPRLPVIY